MEKLNILDSVNQGSSGVLDSASRYAAVNKHFTEVSLTSPSTIIVVSIISLFLILSIIGIGMSVIKAKREKDRLKSDARRNSHLARRKFKINK